MSGRCRSTRQRALPAPRRGPGTPTPVSRLTWASSQAAGVARIERHAVFGGRRASTSTASSSASTSSSVADDPPGVAHVGSSAGSSAREPLGAARARRRAADVGAHRALRLGLRLADLAEHLGGRRVRRDVVVARTPRARRPSATTRGGPSRRATTTTPLRSRTAGAARTAAAASTSAVAERGRADARRRRRRRRTRGCFTSSR